MRFNIIHEIEYFYSAPVFFEPHTFFMRPREDHSQKLIDFRLAITPHPVLNTWEIDAFGNHPFRAWFQGLSDKFTVTAKSQVEVIRPNPFDYLLEQGCASLPVRYSAPMRSLLSGYGIGLAVHPAVQAFSSLIAERTDRATIPFLSELARELSSEFKRLNRPEGDPWSAAQTLEKRMGACRDLTVLFIECCRAQGLAARFTSGYYEGDPSDPEKELHAWCEVYLEGGGWRGFDPSAGLAVSEAHIPVAAGSIPKVIAPVIGAYRGNGVSSKMTTRVAIQRCS